MACLHWKAMCPARLHTSVGSAARAACALHASEAGGRRAHFAVGAEAPLVLGAAACAGASADLCANAGRGNYEPAAATDDAAGDSPFGGAGTLIDDSVMSLTSQFRI